MTDKRAQWYIATTIIGSEDSIFNSLMDKITAYDFNDHVFGMKIINYKDIKVEFFDENNPPPKSMKNSKFIQWFALEDGRYKKVTTKIYNKFPGYIFINMIMTDEIWFIIRNTPGITGFVGSSGKGAKPIPISEDELNDLFSQENEEIFTYVNAKPEDKIGAGVAAIPVTKSAKETKTESKIDDDGFFDSRIETKNSDGDTIEVIAEAIEKEEDLNNDINDFREGHTIKIISGPLAGNTAIIRAILTEKDSVMVEINLLGKENIIKLNINEISKELD